MSFKEDNPTEDDELSERIIQLLRTAKAATLSEIATIVHRRPDDLEPTLHKMESQHLVRLDKSGSEQSGMVVTARGKLFRGV